METTGTEKTFEGRTHIFRGTITMVVAGNLASHALGGFFCDFSTVKKFLSLLQCFKTGTKRITHEERLGIEN